MISINENRNGNDLHMEGNKITLMTEASMIIAGLLKSKVINERDLDSMIRAVKELNNEDWGEFKYAKQREGTFEDIAKVVGKHFQGGNKEE
ncbi:MAG: hypothetical protein K6G88_05760 [Lachnospiraceae bacterium]|nr:hypothetical protein [Lachnospiraceae bacterium]